MRGGRQAIVYAYIVVTLRGWIAPCPSSNHNNTQAARTLVELHLILAMYVIIHGNVTGTCQDPFTRRARFRMPDASLSRLALYYVTISISLI